MGRRVCKLNQVIEDALITLAFPMWVTAIALGALHMPATFRDIWPIGLMAMTGTVLGHWRRREQRDKTANAQRDTAVAELILKAVLESTRSQPAEAGLHLVARESTGSESGPELPSDRHSAG